ncbi:MAG: hypothetical protein QOH00_1331, partial [Gaiellales bacterium]|nr:hypothetical protein [Gaiellales bacterium]
VDSLKDAKIKPDRARVGATVTVTGIAKRPHPTAKDRRFTILPRTAADVVIERQTASDTSGGPAATPRRATTSARSTPATGRGGGSTTPGVTSPGATLTPGQPLDVDLVDLPVSAGRAVRVGGLIVSIGTASLVLDDGTATATADVAGDARAVLSQLHVGLAINLIGKAGSGPGPRLTVTRAEDVIPVADPAAPAASAAPSDLAGPASAAALGASVGPSDAFSLSDAEGVAGEPAPAGSVPLLVGLLLSLALVGVVALLLSRRQPLRLMAHPSPGTRE